MIENLSGIKAIQKALPKNKELDKKSNFEEVICKKKEELEVKDTSIKIIKKDEFHKVDENFDKEFKVELPKDEKEIQEMDDGTKSLLAITSLIKNIIQEMKTIEQGSETVEEFNLKISELNFKFEELIGKLGDLTQEIMKGLNLENGDLSTKINDYEEFEMIMNEKMNEFIENEGNLKEIKQIVSEIVKGVKEVNSKMDETLIKGLVNVKELGLDNTKDLKQKNIEVVIADIEEALKGEEVISIKEMIKGIETLSKINEKIEKGIENLNDKQFDKKPMDMMVQTKGEEKLEVKKDDKILSSILGEEESAKGELSLFSKKMEALNKNIKAENAPVLRKSNIEIDLVKSVKFMNNNEIKELTVKVYPRDLGEIIISVSKEDGVLKAALKANTKETYNILAQNSHELKKLLSEANIRISEADISFYNEDTTFYREDAFDGQDSLNKGKNKEEGTDSNLVKNGFEDEEEESVEENLLNTLA